MSFYELAKPEIAEVERYMAGVLEPEPKGIYGMLPPYIMRGGKRIRPTLAILCCKALGADAGRVVKPAGILELFHNFSLIHDDIADSSEFRRGEPTLHRSHGVPIALNSGDALYTIIFRELLTIDIGPERTPHLQRRFVQTFKEVVEGQGTELEWERGGRFDITEQEYLSMINGKTSALMGFSCEMGAYAAGADGAATERLRSFGAKLGAAFQIHDDVLNVTGTFEKYQKEIGGDITEGKRTLMVVHALARAGDAERKALLRVLSTHSRREADIRKVISIMERHGSIPYAAGIAAAMVAGAKSGLSGLKSGPYRDALLSICDFVTRRES